jgi:hypothetical protein
MHLDLVHVDRLALDGNHHLVAVTGAVVAIGRGQLHGVGAVFVEQPVLGEIGGVSAPRQLRSSH